MELEIGLGDKKDSHKERLNAILKNEPKDNIKGGTFKA